jgi:hypothetical protein
MTSQYALTCLFECVIHVHGRFEQTRRPQGSPCQLALAWRADDTRPVIAGYAAAAAVVAATNYRSTG